MAKLCSKLETDSIYYRREIAQLRAAGRLLPIVPGEMWSDTAISDLATLPNSEQLAWKELLIICAKAKQSKPSAKWQRTAQTALAQVGRENFRQAVLQWFPLVDKPRTQPIKYIGGTDYNLLIHEVHVDILRGLV